MTAGLDALHAHPHTASEEIGQAILKRLVLPSAAPQIIAVNDRFAWLLGSSAAEANGHALTDYASRLAQPDDCTLLAEALSSAVTTIVVLDLAHGPVALN
ncbi:MAG: hypothetical protein ACJ8EW_01580, partial [Rhizobium sp.]